MTPDLILYKAHVYTPGSGNIFMIDPDEIAAARVVLTLFNGKIVYEG
jgi:predicted amidohydrolase YtcJ